MIAGSQSVGRVKEGLSIDQLTVYSVDSILWGEHYGCPKLAAAGRKILVARFADAAGLDSFVRLPFAELAGALGASELSLTREEQAFSALIGWLDAQAVPPSGADVLMLLGKIRFASPAHRRSNPSRPASWSTTSSLERGAIYRGPP